MSNTRQYNCSFSFSFSSSSLQAQLFLSSLDSCLVLVLQIYWGHYFPHTQLLVRYLEMTKVINNCQIRINSCPYYCIALFGVNNLNLTNLWMFLNAKLGSFSRSAVNNESEAKTGLSGLITGIIIGCSLLFLTPVFKYIPQVCLYETLKSCETIFWLLTLTLLLISLSNPQCALAAIVISAVSGLVSSNKPTCQGPKMNLLLLFFLTYTLRMFNYRWTTMKLSSCGVWTRGILHFGPSLVPRLCSSE